MYFENFILLPVISTEISKNKKLGGCSTTMVSQHSCPSSCPLYKAGCYAESGPMGIHTSRLNKSSTISPEDIALIEAETIRKLTGKLPLRLHVVGDCKTDAAAKIVSSAAEDYSSNHGSPVWTYTHGDTQRSSWGKVSVLKSCHSPTQAVEAMNNNFAACIVVDKFESNKLSKINVSGEEIKLLPCPEQSGSSHTCKTCKLCMKDDYLKKNKIVILFQTHGSGKIKASKSAYQKSN